MPNNGITSVYRDDSVRIGETPVGKGVFTEPSYPANAVIGEITGDVVTDCASGADTHLKLATELSWNRMHRSDI